MEKTVIFNEKRIEFPDFLIGESRIKKYVLDASVVFKWYYKKNEADLYSADVLYNFLNSKQHLLFAPQLLIYEILNAFRLKEEISIETIDLIISELYDAIIILETDAAILKKAFLHARILNISVYDGIYIALSEKFDAPLITADKKLYKSAKSLPQKVIMLTDFLDYKIAKTKK
ncbi:MAG: type II toxin-antitoxin system VapC family toxin [Actinobacteria bacterium]|nr:type II toxin-antitoxin system VapC family toxin [Actinomycetota bacterium]MBL7123923.1 type II toxin-antitoxin system VapC family toxin [Actinomycetota bacterium]